MTAKEYLNQARDAKRRIAILTARREKYESLATSGVARYRAGPGGSTRCVSSVEEYALKLVDLTRELDAEIARYADARSEIIGAIRAIDDFDERQVLTLRYLDGWSWRRIIQAMSYSERNVFYIHGRALQKIRVPKSLQ